jgi:hypothetical protein
MTDLHIPGNKIGSIVFKHRYTKSDTGKSTGASESTILSPPALTFKNDGLRMMHLLLIVRNNGKQLPPP